jgi:serine/threonine-protein kinase RsbW
MDNRVAEPVERIPATTAYALVREVAATPSQAGIVRRETVAWAKSRGVTPDTADDIGLAVGEAIANVVDHAYPEDADGTFTLTAIAELGFITVTVIDNGQWKDKPSDPIRGRGTALIRALAAETAIVTNSTGTTVRMTWPWTLPVR